MLIRGQEDKCVQIVVSDCAGLANQWLQIPPPSPVTVISLELSIQLSFQYQEWYLTC